MNIFYEHIYNKKRFGLKAWIMYKKFLLDLKNVMPNFGILWQLAEFIKILERVYFYNNEPSNNTSTFKLFSSAKYKSGENGFYVHNKDIKILIKLVADNDNEFINIEIDRCFGNKIKSSMQFDNVKIPELNEYDTDLLANVINIIMKEAATLLVTYYNKKEI